MFKGTGGETADLGDLVRTVVVDSTVVCRMRRDEVIDNARIQAGDVIVGLASDGQAHYEDSWNGGTGSNGLTSARHDMFGPGWHEKYPECFDPGLPEDLVYTGPFDVTDAVDGVPVDAGKLVLSPTRTYAPVMVDLFKAGRENLHGSFTAAEEARPRCCTSPTPDCTSSRMTCSPRPRCSA